MVRNIIFLLLLLTGLSGCSLINISGFNSGYKKLPDAEKARVVFTEKQDSTCNRPNDQKIYAVTGPQLLHCLKDNDTSVVYIWSPNCHSDVCVSLVAAQYYCTKRNYKLYVVAEYYDFEKTEPQNTNPLALLSVNHLYYNTDRCDAYVSKFTHDITEGRTGKEDRYKRFLFFKKDKWIFARRRLDEKPVL